MRQNSVFRPLLFKGIGVIAFLSPSLVFAQTPLIPCEIGECTFCHLFLLIQNVYNFVMFTLTPPVAILSVAIAGFMWFTAAGNEGQAKKARDILITVVKGLVILYAAWIVINFIITFIASPITLPSESVPIYDPTKWFQIQCQA